MNLAKRTASILFVFMNLVLPAAADVTLSRSPNLPAGGYIDDYLMGSLKAIDPLIKIEQRVRLDYPGDRPLAIRHWDLRLDDQDYERLEAKLRQEHLILDRLAADFVQQVPKLVCAWHDTAIGPRPTDDGRFIIRGGIVEYTVTLRDELFSVRVDKCEGPS